MKKVLILFGGNSYEHEISCKSVNFIIKNIDNTIFDFNVVGIDFDNNWYEIDKKYEIDKNWKKNITNEINNIPQYLKNFDIVFPLIHGNTGEDGKLQSLFEMNNIKYVGCDSYSSMVCYDKLLTKLILDKYRITQVPYIIYNKKTNLDKIKYPVIIKPCKCGSSIGISVANNKEELLLGIKEAEKYDNNIILEKYLTNKRELECAILEKDNKIITSDIGEILDKEWYSFEKKYKLKTDTVISNIDVNIKCKIRKYAKHIFSILKCKDFSRLDFLFDLESKKLYFNEINTIPGLTKISMYPILIENSGIKPKDLLTILLSK